MHRVRVPDEEKPLASGCAFMLAPDVGTTRQKIGLADRGDAYLPHALIQEIDKVCLIPGNAVAADRTLQQLDRSVAVESVAQTAFKFIVTGAHCATSLWFMAGAAGSEMWLSGASAPKNVLWR
ncbi:hypothetical protein D3C87_1814840 [compost metagenome]